MFEPGTTYLRPNEIVPTSTLATDAGTPGLKAEVFSAFDLSGSPVETRTDAQVAVGREPGSFAEPPIAPARSTCWTGWLTPAPSGSYVLGVEGFGNRLLLDGKPHIDTTRGFPPGPSTTELPLEKGRKYAEAGVAAALLRSAAARVEAPGPGRPRARRGHGSPPSSPSPEDDSCRDSGRLGAPAAWECLPGTTIVPEPAA